MFTPYHEVGVTKIRSYQIAELRLCKRIIIITFTFFMPCGKDIVLHSRSPEAGRLIQQNVLKAGTWFRFAEVDTETPRPLSAKFEEIPPFFYNRQVRDEAVRQHM